MLANIYNFTIAASAVVTALATAGLVFYAISQLRIAESAIRESTKDRTAQVLLQIYEIQTALRPKWHELYELPNNTNLWSNEDKQLVDEVCTELQRVSFLCVKKLVDPEFVMESYGKVFVKCWCKLAPWIQSYRNESGEPEDLPTGGYQRKHFEQFAWQCKRYYEQQGLAHGLPNMPLQQPR